MYHHSQIKFKISGSDVQSNICSLHRQNSKQKNNENSSRLVQGEGLDRERQCKWFDKTFIS